MRNTVFFRRRALQLFAVLPLLLLPLFLGGCGEGSGYGGTTPMLLPPHIRKMAVRPFANKTQIFGLEDKLRLRVEEEFIRDGRLPYVNVEPDADGVVIGEIANYIKEPISYDANHVAQEYKLWVIMNLSFLDRVNNVILWTEPRLENEYRYFVETQPGGVTEEEARERLWDLFARDIVKRTIQGFGSVSGASERKVTDRPLAPPAESTATPKAPQERTAPPSPY